MAVVLDPRYKLKLVKFCFTKLDPLTCIAKVKAVEDNMHALFKEYLKNSIIDVDMVESSSGRGDVEMMDILMDYMEEYDIFESQSELGSEKTQLDFYVEEPVLVHKGNKDLDVLKFWRDNRIKHPELSLMARDLLSIPITTVASESAFSIGGRVIGRYQSSILPENAEAKLCSRDWIYGHHASIASEEEDDIAIDVDKIATKIFNEFGDMCIIQFSEVRRVQRLDFGNTHLKMSWIHHKKGGVFAYAPLSPTSHSSFGASSNFHKAPSLSPSSSGNKISPAVLIIIVILAVIIFISGLLHLLVRFLIKHPSSSSSSSPSSSQSNRQPEVSSSEALQRQLQQLFHQHESGLDQAFIDALSVFVYKEVVVGPTKEPFDCAVCCVNSMRRTS